MRGWAALALCLSIGISAQQGLDRKKIPPAGPTPVLRVPTWTKGALANGADVIVSEIRAGRSTGRGIADGCALE